MNLQKVGNQQKPRNKINFVDFLKDPDLHPDPLVRGMDPRVRILTKISWILNTAAKWTRTQFCHLRIFSEDMDGNCLGGSGLESFLASF
jgi:hypothetical protein